MGKSMQVTRQIFKQNFKQSGGGGEGVVARWTKLARSAVLILVVGLTASMAHSQLYHKLFMRGQVVTVTDDQVVICIGSRDGAEAGQTLEVYDLIYEGATTEGGENFRREHRGQITIESIINEHFARAKISSGEVAQHDMVELEMKSK